MNMSKQQTHLPKVDILVVDDTLTNLRLLQIILSNSGYNVRPSRDSALALDSARLRVPDLILLDIDMPGMNGYELCKQLKADSRTCSVPVIFISALDDDPGERAKASAVGGIDYIIKPFRIEDVLARVEANLPKEKRHANHD